MRLRLIEYTRLSQETYHGDYHLSEETYQLHPIDPEFLTYVI